MFFKRVQMDTLFGLVERVHGALNFSLKFLFFSFQEFFNVILSRSFTFNKVFVLPYFRFTFLDLN